MCRNCKLEYTYLYKHAIPSKFHLGAKMKCNGILKAPWTAFLAGMKQHDLLISKPSYWFTSDKKLAADGAFCCCCLCFLLIRLFKETCSEHVLKKYFFLTEAALYVRNYLFLYLIIRKVPQIFSFPNLIIRSTKIFILILVLYAGILMVFWCIRIHLLKSAEKKEKHTKTPHHPWFTAESVAIKGYLINSSQNWDGQVLHYK